MSCPKCGPSKVMTTRCPDCTCVSVARLTKRENITLSLSHTHTTHTDHFTHTHYNTGGGPLSFGEPRSDRESRPVRMEQRPVRMEQRPVRMEQRPIRMEQMPARMEVPPGDDDDDDIPQRAST